jgi:hypothetical protein
MAKFNDDIFSFDYRSYGSDPKRRRKNVDRRPFLLVAYKGNDKVWKAANGGSYMYGFNLNYIGFDNRVNLLRYLNEESNRIGDHQYSYEEIKNIMVLVGINEKVAESCFRKYDVRGGKLRNLTAINLNTYVSVLVENLEK